MLSQLDDVWYHLSETWEDRKQLLTQCYDLQVYEEYAEQADVWLQGKEGFLANEDLGVSVVPTQPYVQKIQGGLLKISEGAVFAQFNTAHLPHKDGLSDFLYM